ncbi:hypothetical protein SCAB_23191 [Streptomyces scabiei 87.22]|uniref:Uncharacterized protein n=1 Tax=Streptomyces scabiei (strain 87.22) TaxID=680198 RepID=C9YYX7_STRSW|nr:hypothetical protein SCAB_23191 [Streptomyces scabiei 87.22]
MTTRVRGPRAPDVSAAGPRSVPDGTPVRHGPTHARGATMRLIMSQSGVAVHCVRMVPAVPAVLGGR